MPRPAPASCACSHLDIAHRFPCPHFSSEANIALCGYGLTPALGAKCVPPEFVVMMHDGRPLVLPVDVWRSTIWELPRRWSFYSDKFQVILLQSFYQSGPHPLYGIVRGTDGRLAVLWSGSVPLP